MWGEVWGESLDPTAWCGSSLLHSKFQSRQMRSLPTLDPYRILYFDVNSEDFFLYFMLQENNEEKNCNNLKTNTSRVQTNLANIAHASLL